MGHETHHAVERLAGIRRDREWDAGALHNAADQGLRHCHDQAQARDLMQAQQRRRPGAGPDERARVHVALGDDAFEGRANLQVLDELLDRLGLGLRRLD